MSVSSPRPLVTVAMSVFNQRAYVARAMRSVLAQSYRRFEFIIVDDGSTDGTAQVLRGIRDPRIRLVLSRQNLGKGIRMNQLLRAARGKYLLEMDGDDWLEPHALAVLVRTMRGLSPSVAEVHGDRRFHVVSRRGVKATTRFGSTYRGRHHFLLWPVVSGPRFYRTAALRAVGGWPLNYPSRGRLVEDLALLLRLTERFRLHRVARVLYNVRRHGRNISLRRRKQALGARAFLLRQARRRDGVPVEVSRLESLRRRLRGGRLRGGRLKGGPLTGGRKRRFRARGRTFRLARRSGSLYLKRKAKPR